MEENNQINRLLLHKSRQIFPISYRVSSQVEATMEIEVSSSNPDSESKEKRIDLDSIRVKRKTLQNLLEDCQKALELLELTDIRNGGEQSESPPEEESDREESSSSSSSDPEADKVCLLYIYIYITLSSVTYIVDSFIDCVTRFMILVQFYDLMKSRVECNEFREKIELAQVSIPQDLSGKNISLCLPIRLCYLVL